jgi:nucleoside-diphosphate-sugar epimerase
MSQDDFHGPVNIGSEEMVTINELVMFASMIGNKSINIKHIDGPLGVRGRNSDNKLIEAKLDWKPNVCLFKGLGPTYKWIEAQCPKKN